MSPAAFTHQALLTAFRRAWRRDPPAPPLLVSHPRPQVGVLYPAECREIANMLWHLGDHGAEAHPAAALRHTGSREPGGQGPAVPVLAFLLEVLQGAGWGSEQPAGVLYHLADFLVGKNREYGNSALDPVRCASTAGPLEQIRVRIDDKISRLLRGGPAALDTMVDLAGYLLIYLYATDEEAR